MKTKCSKCGRKPALSYHSYCYACLRISKGENPIPKFRRDVNNKTMCSRCKKKPRAKGHNYCKECRSDAVKKCVLNKGGWWGYVVSDPERHKRALSRKLIYNWLIRGKIQRQPCELCGDPNSESHHDDYSIPGSVRWLCKKHHEEADRLKELFDKKRAVA